MSWLAIFLSLASADPATPACGVATLAAVEVDAGGSVNTGARCGEIVLATDASDAVFSWGAARYRTPLPADYEVSLRWQRLTHDSHRTLELFIPGGAILVRDGSFAFYENDARFVAEGGWRPLPGHDTRAWHAIRVRQRGHAVEAWLDDEPLGTYVFAARPAVGTLRVALKGERSYRGRMRYRDVVIAPLSSQ